MSSAASSIPTWRTVMLGVHSSIKSFIAALRAKGNTIDVRSRILSKVSLAPKRTKIELVRISVAELGFPEGATLQEIYQRGVQRGFNLCPGEVGLALREQYGDSQGQLLFIAMAPIADPADNLFTFTVYEVEHVRCLASDVVHSNDRYHPDDSFIFARRKK
jgi:hypothetical protein